MNRIKGILFDLDGTLFDHRGAADAAITAWVARRFPGHPRLGEAAAIWAALEAPYLAMWQEGRCSVQEQRRLRLAALCDELALPVPGDLDAAYDAFATLYREHWAAFPDAAGALAELGGYTIGVLTNGTLPMQEAKVRAIGLAGLVGPVLTGEVLGGHFKPAPACYTGAAAALGLPPQEVLLVGDDLDNDVTGPAVTGMRSIWLDRLTAGPPPDGFPRITSLAELPPLVAR
ncbi:2-haloalkanoic acid dehalogenase [[Actinomadura] parvosata subsp. kistnae]|uniref:HAD family hydrolase n=1 Tax=[Actinomadura] parvosata TaxID=1955412 RepID=UPI0009AC5E53|nr:HAD family hydrolase [Nonomuraea sp. ATCC 55076]SPL97846.1 2-haloalkanoic acid dehalogenase [Actinomadura parvosata subsp. kistnae]